MSRRDHKHTYYTFLTIVLYSAIVWLWYPILRVPTWQVILTFVLTITNTVGLCVVMKPQLHNSNLHGGVVSALIILLNSLFQVQQTFWLGQIVIGINIVLIRYLYTFFSVHDVARITFLFTILCTLTTPVSLPQILLLIVLAIVTWQQDLFNVRIILAMLLGISLLMVYHIALNYFFWNYKYIDFSTMFSNYTWCSNLFTSQQLSFVITMGVCWIMMVLLVIQDYSFETQRRKYPIYLMLVLVFFTTVVVLFPERQLRSFTSAIVPIGVVFTHFVDIRPSFLNNVVMTLLCATTCVLAYLLRT